MKITLLAILFLFVCSLSAVPAAAKRPMTIDDLFRFQRVSDPQIGPDGKLVVYVVTTVDMAENKTVSTLWVGSPDGAKPRQLTTTTKKDKHPRWSPDSKQILFESNRSGDNQLWVIDMDGGEARQLTNISTEASTGIWSPDGQWIAFVSSVWPEFSDKPFAESDALNKKRKEETAKNPVKAKVFTKLFFRHWDEYVEDKRQHLFVIPATGGEPKDVTLGDRDANPTSTTFSAGDDLTFTPDSKYLVFTAPPERDEAWSTNYDLCKVSIKGGKIKTLTADNKAADGYPRFSPDGKWLAYRSQKRAGFEADKWEIMVVDADFKGKPKSVTAKKFDRSADAFVWSPVDHMIFFTADKEGVSPIFVTSITSAWPQDFAGEYTNSLLSISKDGLRFAHLTAAMNQPPEATVTMAIGSGAGTATVNVSKANENLLAEIDLPRPESVTLKVQGAEMQMWILKPPGFDPKKKWPLVYLVHGGPQGAWEDSWSYRWNPELWAAQGYVVAMPNPRGSTGFGQKFVDEISGDWGGKCFDDLMAGLAYLEKQPYIDTQRMAAAGASFGGYMVNWFAGHTDKFKTLISHCGVFNFDSMYSTTEELWFDEWEHGGPPWLTRESYEKHSPHRFAKNFKTPMLIIQNDLDFRVPVSEGIQLFTTLQRLGVPSKMINFPDEGHWVLKPANSKYWHEQVFAWLQKYVPPGGRK